MALSAGSRFGPYEIVGAIGSGGMGEVYRARDTRLDRDVAIKILPEAVAADPERLARFEREARALASLNHHNICAIYDIGRETGVPYLVMELVDGETLAARLARGPLPIDQALRCAIELASALDRAHRQAIVHRDVKPANVILTKMGAKLLDFGLAKLRPATSPTATLMPTQLADQTAQGMILGTLQYMSPEQLEGGEADARSDIFGLGAMLFEMVTGRKAFEGRSQASLISAIMSSAPPSIAALQPLAPAALDRIVRTCLAKDPDERWQTAGDLGRELRWIADEQKLATSGAVNEAVASSGSVPAHRRKAIRPIVWLASAAAVVVAAAGVWALVGLGGRDTRVTYSGAQFATGEFASDPRVSPNGSLVAFQVMVDGQTQVAVMQPESGDFTVLTHDRSRGAISSTSWTADGTRIYYGRIDGVPRGVFSVSAVGGEERLVLEDAVCPITLPDGSLLVAKINEARQYQIYRYWPDARRTQPYNALIVDGVDYQRVMFAFRDGKEAVFWGRTPDQPASDPRTYLQLLDLPTGTTRRLQGGDGTTGRLIYAPSITASADGQAIVTIEPAGDLTRVIAIPRAGGKARELTSLTDEVTGLDIAPNGDLYIDQMSRPLDAVLMEADGSRPQTLLTFSGLAASTRMAMALPDGRLVFGVSRGGKSRLLIAKAGQNPAPFIQTDDETSGPVAPIGTQEVALLLGSARTLAIASTTDGRIVRRLEHAHGAAISQISALPDGKTLFYAAAGKIWSIASSEDAKPQAVRDGDSVAVDPRDGSLIIQLNEPNKVRFVRHSLTGKPEQALSFPDVRPTTTALGGNAIGPNGVLLKNANYTDSWPWNLALLHPDTGKSQRIILPLRDVQVANWIASGQFVVFAPRTSAKIWRLRPAR